MRLHFDGEPNRFAQMLALFPKVDTLRRNPEWARPVADKFRLRAKRIEDWFLKYARRTA